MIKRYKDGDTLICIKKYRYDGITPNVIFEFGKQYKIDYILGYFNDINGSSKYIYKIDGVSFYEDENNSRYIDKYFCDSKEYRLRKLRILNCK